MKLIPLNSFIFFVLTLSVTAMALDLIGHWQLRIGVVAIVLALLATVLFHRWQRERASASDLRARVAELVGAEERMRQQLQQHSEVESERDRLISVMEATTDMVGLADPNGRLLYLNRTGREWIGENQVVDMQDAIMVVHPTWAAQRIQNEGIPTAIRDGHWSGETAILTADGGEMPVSQVILSHYAPDGSLAYMSTVMRDISQTKRIEAELRASRAELSVYKRLVESSGQAIGIASMDARISYANAKLFELLGLDPDASFDQYTFYEFYDQKGLERLETEVLPAVRDVGQWTGEIDLIARDGRRRRTLQNVFMLRDEKGEPSAFANIIADLSPLKTAQASLQRAQFLLDNAPQEVWLARMDGQIVYANHSAASSLGYSRDELVGLNVSDVDPATGGDFLQQAQAMKDSGVRPTFETKHRTRDGRLIPKEVHAAYLALPDEEFICGFVLDLTERKRAETVLRIRESGIASAINAIAFADLEGHLTYANAAFLHMWGYSEEQEVLGRAALDFWQRREQAAEVVRVLRNEGRWTGAMVALRKDGSVFDAALSAVLVRDSDGTPVQLMASFLDITENKRFVEALQRNEQQLREAQALAHLGSWGLDLATGKAEWSDEEYRLLGYEPGEVEAHVDNFLQRVHPADVEDVNRAMQQAMQQVDKKSTTAYRVEHRVLEPSGQERILLERGYVRFSDDGQPLQMLGTSLDVTALRRSEQRLVEAQRIANIGSWELDLIRDELSWSEQVFRIFEIDHSKFGASYQAFLDLIHPDDRELVNRAYNASIEEHKPYDISHRLQMEDGRVKYVRETGETVDGPDGQPILSRGTVQDITELRLAEVQLKEYREHLEELVAERTRKLQQQAMIIDQTHDSVVTTDLEGVVQSWNKGAERLFGYSADEMVGRNVATVYPESEQAFLVEQVIGPLMANGEHEVEVKMQRKSGEPFYAHLSLSLLHDSDGKPSGMIGYSLDITRRKRAEQRLRRREIELTALNRELEAFSYSVSHDLRAPLRGIDGFSQALIEDYGNVLDDNGLDYLRRTRAAAQRMGQLIDDLLNLSRVSRVPTKLTDVDLSSMGAEILQALAEKHPDRNVEWKIADGMTVLADSGLMRVALENLLGNAWKYTARRAVAHIEFGVRDDQGERVFFVRDDGAGFDMRHVDKLFGAFQRLHSITEFEGTGIGLATVQRIIERLGGRVWAEAEIDKGAEFDFVLENGNQLEH